MTRSDRAISVSLILIGAIVIALSSPRLLSGLSLPPDSEDRALFEIVPPVLIVAAIGLIALFRHRITRLSPGRSWLLWVIVPFAAMSASAGVYLHLSSKTIIRYRNAGDESQSDLVLVPLVLTRDMEEQIETYGWNRSMWLNEASPSYIEENFGGPSPARSLTVLALVSCYTAIFTFLALALSGAAALLAGRWSRPAPAQFPAAPPAPAGGYDAFICHASEDAPWAAADICRGLEANGLRCWVAPRDIPAGAEWAASIVEGIRSCRTFVLVFTEAANRSPHIKREFAFATERRIPIVMIRLEHVPLCPEIEYFGKTCQWIDMSLPPVKAEMERLAERIRQIAAGPAARGSERDAPPETST